MNNPYAWSKSALAPRDITAITPENRMISWPYVKRMVANPNVNQGAAIIVTSLARARAAGVPEDQLVFIGAGASATEPRDWLARDAYTVSHAQDAVLEAMLARRPEIRRARSLFLLPRRAEDGAPQARPGA